MEHLHDPCLYAAKSQPRSLHVSLFLSPDLTVFVPHSMFDVRSEPPPRDMWTITSRPGFISGIRAWVRGRRPPRP